MTRTHALLLMLGQWAVAAVVAIVARPVSASVLAALAVGAVLAAVPFLLGDRRGSGDTRERELSEQLRRMEKLASVGQLAASVGHELRNPLAAIRNAHTYLGRKIDSSDPKVAQFMALIDRELAATSRIISELLDFARERPPSLAPCPLRPLVTEAASLVPARPNVAVVNEISDDMPVPELDREQFRQVFVNLVQNGVESMPDGRKDGAVRVTAEGGGDRPWRITIADNGAGIPAEALRKIFQPLFTTKVKGTGLGLAIVSGMIQRHNGTITVESEVGHGTRFVIELPAASKQARAA
jgi:two-component system, NtrC family, sensor histidine kinase HydH